MRKLRNYSIIDKKQYVDMTAPFDSRCIRWRDGGVTFRETNMIAGLTPIDYLRKIYRIVVESVYVSELMGMEFSFEEYVSKTFEVEFEDVLDETVKLSWHDIFKIYDEVLGSLEYMSLGDWFFSSDNVPHSWSEEEGIVQYQNWLQTENATEIFKTLLNIYGFFIEHHSGMGFIYACKLKNGLIGNLSVDGKDWEESAYGLDNFQIDHSWANHITGMFYTNVSFYLDDNQYTEEVERSFKSLRTLTHTGYGATIGIEKYHEYDLKDGEEITYSTFRMPLCDVIRMIGYKPMSAINQEQPTDYLRNDVWFYYQPVNMRKSFDWRWLGRNVEVPNTERDGKMESDE